MSSTRLAARSGEGLPTIESQVGRDAKVGRRDELQMSGQTIEVASPFDSAVVGLLSEATPDDVEVALSLAQDASAAWAHTPAYSRSELLNAFADAVEARQGELATTITLEQGKPLAQARGEASRVVTVLRLSAHEALRLTGEVLPLDSAPNGVGRLGFTLREPCGVVVAITPFNYPASLVALKLGPALAGGNVVIVKPPSETPLSALLLRSCAEQAGLPGGVFQVLCGRGSTVGTALCADSRVRFISFTGSNEVAAQITGVAGAKRSSLELGSNAALVVLQDADIGLAALATAQDGFTNAGQVCIAAQRVIVDRSRGEEFLEALLPRVQEITLGDPRDATTSLGPVISEPAAKRILAWVDEAKGGGAQVRHGGDADGTLVQPTVVLNPPTDSRVWDDEVFGPVVAIRFVDGVDEALDLANATRYGLAASVFTSDLATAVRSARDLRAGVVHVNNGPCWKSDFMPYGGIGDSGFGKEGIQYATNEMTETKTVVMHLP